MNRLPVHVFDPGDDYCGEYYESYDWISERLMHAYMINESMNVSDIINCCSFSGVDMRYFFGIEIFRVK